MTLDNVLTIVGIAISSTIVGMTGAWAWFRSSKARIYERIEKVEEEMTTYAQRHQDWHNENKLELHGIKITQGYVEDAIHALKASSQSTTKSLDKLIEALLTAKENSGNGGNGHRT